MLYTTNVPAVDHALTIIIQRLEAAFPNRIRAYYLHGSHTDGSAIDTSDVDLSVVFKGVFLSDTEASSARKLVATLTTHINLDLSIEEEAALLFQADPAFKLAGQLLYGEEIRPQIPLMSIEAWTRDRLHTSYWRIGKLFHRAMPIQFPLDYPDPNDEFYGYVRRPVRLEYGNETTSTRDLIRAVGWMATALIALQAGEYVTRKADLVQMYQQTIGDEWGSLIEETYRCCKVEWRYRIPADHNALRDLCRRVLTFENYFLTVYKSYLLQELTTDDMALLRHQLWLLDQVPWQDDEVMQAAHTARQKLLPQQLLSA